MSCTIINVRLEHTIIELLRRRGATLAVAESCTGGLLAKRLTDIPGASEAFPGGVVAYSAQSKTALLGVDARLINEKGAVSREVALAMADGARKRFGADIGIGITGVAGPDGDGSGVAPGVVFIALAASDESFCREFKLPGGRARVRAAAASQALKMLRKYLIPDS